MKQSNFTKMTLVAVFAFTGIATSTGMAQSGANGSGGAHGTRDHQLLDLHEARGSKKMDPLTFPGVKESLADIAMKLPGLADQMKLALNKPWYFVESKLSCPGGESMLDIKKEPVACQNKFEILISEKWFNTPPNFEKRDQENELYSRYLGRNRTEALKIKQHATIIHELLRNLRLKKERTIDSEAGLRYLVRTLIPTAPDDGVLQMAAAKADFGFHSTGSFIREMKSYLGQIKNGINLLYNQIATTSIAIRQMTSQLDTTYRQNAQPILDKFTQDNAQLTERFSNRTLGREEYLRLTNELGAQYHRDLGTQMAVFNMGQQSLETFVFDKASQMNSTLVGIQPPAKIYLNLGCDFESIGEILLAMQRAFSIENKNPKNGSLDLAIKLENLTSQQRAIQMIERIEGRLSSCEAPKSTGQ